MLTEQTSVTDLSELRGSFQPPQSSSGPPSPPRGSFTRRVYILTLFLPTASPRSGPSPDHLRRHDPLQHGGRHQRQAGADGAADELSAHRLAYPGTLSAVTAPGDVCLYSLSSHFTHHCLCFQHFVFICTFEDQNKICLLYVVFLCFLCLISVITLTYIHT